VPFDDLNRRFIDLKKDAFSIGQEAENDFKVQFEDLNHRFFELIEIASWACQEAEISSQFFAITRKIAILTSIKSYFGLVPEPESKLKQPRVWRPFETLLSRLSVGQEAENDFKVPIDNLNPCYFEFFENEFCTGQEVKISSQYLATT